MSSIEESVLNTGVQVTNMTINSAIAGEIARKMVESENEETEDEDSAKKE